MSDTPLPTATQVVPAVLSHNIFRPGGQALDIWVKPPQDGRVSIRIYSLAGDLVQPVFESDLPAGVSYQARWDGKNLNGEAAASGVYFVSVKGAGIKSVRKVIVLR